ncbi:MFS transporter [Humisphaera borealis]|uniref:MFS transporter n=1 Tax=Humisphaera borealis TaxID=2807512 RepID=A0A7M2X4E6_9BACT|nr:MFS transporter [Humisphaera borealis]QOV92535.1 MFS transporter [Humisphaera borealis]
MPISIEPSSQSDNSDPGKPWYKLLSGYHWFVFIIASAAWLFDCLDQRLFSLARIPALNALAPAGTLPADVQAFGKVVTAFFLIGWGIGGLIFGALGDKFGRSKMLMLTILIYSLFTGLSFFSHSWFDFTACRFLTGLGVGGVFGLAVALIAETVPSGARVQALGLLQVLSTVGNVMAVGIKYLLDSLEKNGTITGGEGWRWMFLVGLTPAIMVVFSYKRLKEPESWLKLKNEGKLPKGSILVPYQNLVRSTRWRRNLIVGSLIASTGVIGLWAIGEYAVDLQNMVFGKYFTEQAALGKIAKTDIKLNVENAKTLAYLLNMLGAGVGMWLFTKVAAATGRRTAFAIGFVAALVVTAFTYWKMETPIDAYWMMPLMGAAQLGPFAGFAIYLPELFPGSLRSTGTSFCYNLGRFAAAGGSFFSAYLTKLFTTSDATSSLPLRYSAIAMCSIFLIGLFTLPFAPETKGKPLPSDEVAPPEPGFAPAPAGTPAKA